MEDISEKAPKACVSVAFTILSYLPRSKIFLLWSGKKNFQIPFLKIIKPYQIEYVLSDMSISQKIMTVLPKFPTLVWSWTCSVDLTFFIFWHLWMSFFFCFLRKSVMHPRLALNSSSWVLGPIDVCHQAPWIAFSLLSSLSFALTASSLSFGCGPLALSLSYSFSPN